MMSRSEEDGKGADRRRRGEEKQREGEEKGK